MARAQQTKVEIAFRQAMFIQRGCNQTQSISVKLQVRRVRKGQRKTKLNLSRFRVRKGGVGSNPGSFAAILTAIKDRRRGEIMGWMWSRGQHVHLHHCLHRCMYGMRTICMYGGGWALYSSNCRREWTHSDLIERQGKAREAVSWFGG
jgi:hypothetical protein